MRALKITFCTFGVIGVMATTSIVTSATLIWWASSAVTKDMR